jgi:RNA polymerase sigma-70 factor (ECF subfamily)
MPVLPARPVEVRPLSRAATFSMARRDDFDQFFLDNHAALVRTLTVITGDGELADDVVQEAFQRAYVRWNRIHRYDAPASWVRRVAINRARDLIRSDQRRRANEEKVAPAEATADEEAPHHVLQMLMELPERQRTAMALYYLEGLSVEQAAEEMSVSAGAVKYHLHEGRNALRPMLEHEEQR